MTSLVFLLLKVIAMITLKLQYGLQFIVGDGELELIGTGTDSDELWFDGSSLVR